MRGHQRGAVGAVIVPFVLVALACALFALGGYLSGVRRAVDARDALRAELSSATSERDVARAELQRVEGDVDASGDEARRAGAALTRAQADLVRAQAEHGRVAAELGRTQGELARVESEAGHGREELTRAQAALEQSRATTRNLERDNATLARTAQSLEKRVGVLEAEVASARAEAHRADLAYAQAQAEVKRLAAALTQRRDAARDDLREVERILSPLLERERVAQAIQHVDLGRGTRDELPRILDAIARASGLSALVLSDDSGLPLAASEGSERAEVLAGVWAQLLIVADRVVENGEPAPSGVRVDDVSGRVLAHRIFTAGRERFLLIAVGRAGGLGPDVLEPAVAKLERVLVRDAWQ